MHNPWVGNILTAKHKSGHPLQMTGLEKLFVFFNPLYIEYPVVEPFNHRWAT
jgi:hypothetical protein